jgi:hypothetical protein
VGGPVRGAHRLDGSGRRDGSSPQRCAGGSTQAVRAGVLARADGRRGGASRVRRRRVLPDRARSERPSHPHGAVVHERRGLAGYRALDELILPGL